jgi:hypothetical protein
MEDADAFLAVDVAWADDGLAGAAAGLGHEVGDGEVVSAVAARPTLTMGVVAHGACFASPGEVARLVRSLRCSPRTSPLRPPRVGVGRNHDRREPDKLLN